MAAQPATVGSFLISRHRFLLFSVKSVASSFKKVQGAVLPVRAVFAFALLPFAFLASCLLPSADRLLSLGSPPSTVGSYPIPINPDPLLSCKSVASFFKKLSAFGHQPSEEVEQSRVLRSNSQERSLVSRTSSTFDLQPSTFNSSSPNGGFVPHFRRARSFVIMQIGGFVFQKALSFQPSADQMKSNSRGFKVE